MNIDHRIERCIQTIKASRLSAVNRARAIQILEAIRIALHALHRLISSLIRAIRQHREAVVILGLAILVAVLVEALPVIGNLVGFLVILIGAGTAFIAEVRRALNTVFTFDIGPDIDTAK